MRRRLSHALLAATTMLGVACAAVEHLGGEPETAPANTAPGAASAASDARVETPPTPPTDRRETRPDPAPRLEPFTETISGTTVEFKMVPIHAGGRSFWLGRTEVTWDMYDVFVFELDKPRGAAAAEGGAKTGADAVSRPSRPYVSPDLGYGHDGYAAISLSYLGAEHFCKWLSAKTGRHYRLPTETEWRLACAAGGVTAETADAHAWHDENADFTPHPVATKKADATGLHDLWGNVREWCRGDDGKPVALGGSFMDLPGEIGCAARHEPTPDWQMTDPQVPKSKWWLSDAPFAGFRVLCDPAPPPAADPPAPDPEGETDDRP